MKLQVVLNPAARSGRAGRRQESIRAAFSRRGIDCEFLLTSAPGSAATLLSAPAARRADAVVAAGGDGTLTEVVNAVCELDAEARPVLGLLPLGTGNAFARDLGLAPGDWRGGVDIIAAGHRRRVDVARVSTPDEHFHFINILGLGLVTDAGRAARRLKWAGNGAYTLGVLYALLGLRSRELRIEVDGTELREDALLATVSNSRFTGTHFLIAPRARVDDGRLDLTVVRQLPRRRLLRLFPSIYHGRHVDFEDVLTRQAQRIRILAPEDAVLMVDGELRGRTPAEIRCLPGHLDLFWPGPKPGGAKANKKGAQH